MAIDVGIWAAFGGGAISFLSPCVLPLVPSYLCYVTGESLEDLTATSEQDRPATGHIMAAAGAFVLGFATVFVSLGATASAVGQLLSAYKGELAIAAGVLIIIMGLNFLGLFRIGFLARDVRYRHKSRPAGLIGAYLIGLAFAFGWTPCIGPILGPIITLAGAQETMTEGAALLAVYSLGLGVPFLIAAYGVNGFMSFMTDFRRHLGKVEKAMGAMLVLTGVLFLTGAMQEMSYWMLETFPELATFG